MGASSTIAMVALDSGDCRVCFLCVVTRKAEVKDRSGATLGFKPQLAPTGRLASSLSLI